MKTYIKTDSRREMTLLCFFFFLPFKKRTPNQKIQIYNVARCYFWVSIQLVFPPLPTSSLPTLTQTHTHRGTWHLPNYFKLCRKEKNLSLCFPEVWSHLQINVYTCICFYVKFVYKCIYYRHFITAQFLMTELVYITKSYKQH